MTTQQHKKAVLIARQIHKAFYNPVAVPILKGVDLEVASGEAVAIMGRSGEGKSTLLHILGTLEKPCQGTLRIAQKDVSFANTSSIRNQHIGFVFQSFHLLEDYTVLENVLFPARIARKSTSQASAPYQYALELLDIVGLTDRAMFNAKQLSGGEKQRVAIARAMINDPDIILADEPSGNLDHTTADHIHNLLLNFARKQGKALVLVTHDQGLADLCDRVLHLQQGVLVEEPKL